MKTLKRIIPPRFVCFILGHKKAVSMLNEDEYCIWDKGCPRCKQPVLFPIAWKSTTPPPGTGKEEYKKFLIEYFENLRASIIKEAQEIEL